MERLDHGILNIPLAKRGNIDAELDRYKERQAREARAAAKARGRDGRAKKARISEILSALPDGRVLALAAPLGKRTPATARAALASAASYHVDRWLASLERELAAQVGTP